MNSESKLEGKSFLAEEGFGVGVTELDGHRKRKRKVRKFKHDEDDDDDDKPFDDDEKKKKRKGPLYIGLVVGAVVAYVGFNKLKAEFESVNQSRTQPTNSYSRTR